MMTDDSATYSDCDERYMMVAYQADMDFSTTYTATVTIQEGEWFPFSTGASLLQISAVVVAGALALF